MTTGEKIKFYRKKRGLTLKELGLKSGYLNHGDVRIAQYENGSRYPRLETLERIAKSLDISVSVLIEADCRRCPYRKEAGKREVYHHLEDDLGYETDNKRYKDSEEEGFLYDNLD